MRPRLLFAIGAIAFSSLFSGAASAAAVMPGIPVGSLSETDLSNYVGTIVTAPSGLGGTAGIYQINGTGGSNDAIKYYIPLRSDTSGTYGVDAGTSSDTCLEYDCGGTLHMYLAFDIEDAEAGTPHFLRFYFNDLDLDGVNDPLGFLESIEIYSGSSTTDPLFSIDLNGEDENGDPVPYNTTPPTPPFTEGDYVVNADEDNQSILFYNVPVTDPFYVHLVFSSVFDVYEADDGCYYSHNYHKWKHCGSLTNTAEYLRAEVEAWPPELVPVPAALPLFISGLAALGFVGARRRKNQKAPDA